jgi:hypothetical protein
MPPMQGAKLATTAGMGRAGSVTGGSGATLRGVGSSGGNQPKATHGGVGVGDRGD